MSFLVGYGARFLAKVHHRAASLSCRTSTSRSSSIGGAQRFDDWFICKGANPNVVVGAIVGEPDRRDRFRDQRDGGGDVAYPNMMDDEISFYMPGPGLG